MALIGNNADTLLQGLSDFWLRYFKDIGDLQAIYEGTEILLGQHYLNLLNDVLNITVTETPLFRKEYYKLYTVREDQLRYRDTGTIAQARYVFTSDEPIVAVPQLQNKVYNPTAALEDGVEYEVIDGALAFAENPFTSNTLRGFARRQVDVAVSGFFTTTDPLVGVPVQPGDILYLYTVTQLPVDQGARFPLASSKLTVTHVANGRLAIATDTTLPPEPPTPVAYQWELVRQRVGGILVSYASGTGFTGSLTYTSTLQVEQLALWAVDARIDDYRLYETFGHLFGDKRRSTESYRAFIRGLMQLYILGPAIARVESALNVVANLPVIRDDGEILQEYRSGTLGSGATGALLSSGTTAVFTASSAIPPPSVFRPEYVGYYVWIKGSRNPTNQGLFQVRSYIDPNTVELYHPTSTFVSENGVTWELTIDAIQRVITDKNTYSYPSDIPMRSDVVTPANFGKLIFRAFEPLTTAVQVTDYIEDPEWWYNITIPEEILPGLPREQRVVSPELYPNYIGATGNAYIGDAGYFIGADENGQIPSQPDGETFRHLATFILVDRFLKTHLFMVRLDGALDLTGVLIQELQQLIKEVKPAHTQVYFQPFTVFHDIVDVVDDLDLGARLPLTPDEIPVVDNVFRIGDAAIIGAFGRSEGMVLTVGGQDPGVTGTGLLDQVLELTVRPVIT
jgi:hypothetical protein